MLTAILIIAALAGIVLLKMRPAGKSSRGRAGAATGAEVGRPAKARASFHSVSISMDASPCHAIRKYEGKRLLSNEAPGLPLPDCDQSNCSCRFEHFDDRRDAGNRRDRVVAIGRMASSDSSRERRTWKDRRTSR
jgi:hypothetical protein